MASTAIRYALRENRRCLRLRTFKRRSRRLLRDGGTYVQLGTCCRCCHASSAMRLWSFFPDRRRLRVPVLLVLIVLPCILNLSIAPAALLILLLLLLLLLLSSLSAHAPSRSNKAQTTRKIGKMRCAGSGIGTRCRRLLIDLTCSLQGDVVGLSKTIMGNVAVSVQVRSWSSAGSSSRRTSST